MNGKKRGASYNAIMYFDSFEVELNIFQKKNVCGYFSIGFIDFMLKGKNLLHDTNLFSPN